jgi:hypothetical protein
MSIHLMDHVWKHSRHSEGALLVMLAIADYAGDHGYAWPSIPSVAKKTRLTPQAVYRILNRLTTASEGEEPPELERLPGGGRSHPNLYRVCLPIMDECPDCQAEREHLPPHLRQRVASGTNPNAKLGFPHNGRNPNRKTIVSQAENPNLKLGDPLVDPSGFQPSGEEVAEEAAAAKTAAMGGNHAPPAEPLTPETLQEMYNAMVSMAALDLPRCADLTPGRRHLLLPALRRQPDPAYWRRCFENLATSKFLQGQEPGANGRRLHISFDWLFRRDEEGVENYAKVYDGNFRNRSPAPDTPAPKKVYRGHEGHNVQRYKNNGGYTLCLTCNEEVRP